MPRQRLDASATVWPRRVHRETDGNPFFVTEVLRHLRDTGAIYQDAAGRWVASGTIDRSALPDSVREVIGGRVVRLGPDADRVLSTAAVIGRDFDLDVLARATRIPVDALLDILEAATTASLVQEVDDVPVGTTSATRSSSTRSTRTWDRPGGRDARGGRPGVGRLLR